MEREKVKEIKKALQQTLEYCARELEKKLFQDCLTLINELESENERIKQSAKNLAYVNDKLIERNGGLEQEIKRIAIERNKKDELASKFIKAYDDGLKQFVERLKEKAIPNGEIVKEFYIVNIEQIDETLKEFIGE